MSRRLLALLAPLVLGACTRPDQGPLEVPPLEYGHDSAWPAKTELPPLGSGRIVITNSLDDTVSLLPLDTLGTEQWGELARVPV